MTVLVLCEFAVRYLQAAIPAHAETPYRRDPDCGYVLRAAPDQAFPEDDDRHVNALGFRDRERAVPPAGDRRRVVGLGDSFVYGDVPISRNFLRLLDDARPGTETLIAGLPGWDVRNAVGWLRSRAATVRPDEAILCFSVGSDVTGIPIPGAVYQGNLHFVGSRRPWLNALRKSHLFVLAEQLYLTRTLNALRGLRARAAVGGTPADAPAVRATDRSGGPPLPEGAPWFRGMWGETEADRTPCSADFLHRQAENLGLYVADPDPEVAGLWAEAERQLLEFDAVCRTAGVEWVLLAAPAEIQVDPVVRAAVLELAPGEYDFDAPQRRLAAFAAAHGIRLVDPLAALREAQAATGIRQYIPNNGHWNVPGNALVAELLLGDS